MGTAASKKSDSHSPTLHIPTPPPPPLPPSPPPPHQIDTDEEDTNVKQLGECSSIYLALQECLVRTDRNWKSCQPEVQALKSCQSRKNDLKEK